MFCRRRTAVAFVNAIGLIAALLTMPLVSNAGAQPGARNASIKTLSLRGVCFCHCASCPARKGGLCCCLTMHLRDHGTQAFSACCSACGLDGALLSHGAPYCSPPKVAGLVSPKGTETTEWLGEARQTPTRSITPRTGPPRSPSSI